MASNLSPFYLMSMTVLLAGCATIDSARHEDRMRALSKIQDQQTLGDCVENAKFVDVREAAIDRITDPVILLRIIKKRPVRKEIRQKALDRLVDDDHLLEVISSSDLEMEFRLNAARRLSSDLAKSNAISYKELAIFERKALLLTIEDEGILSGIALNTNLPAELRFAASMKIDNESVLLRCLYDSTFSINDRNQLAKRLKSAEVCEKALFADDLSQESQQFLAGRIIDEIAKLRVLSIDKVAIPVRCALVKSFFNQDRVAGIILNENLPVAIRKEAADTLRNRKDGIRLVDVFRKSKDLTGAVLAVSRVTDASTTSLEDQNRLLAWFKKAETSLTGNSTSAMECLSGKMHINSSLWYVAEESPKAPYSIRESCLLRITDQNMLIKAACRKGDKISIREIALEKLKEDVGAIRKVFHESKDIKGAILALERLPPQEIRASSAQQKLAIWLSSLSEKGDDLELSVKILPMLAPESEIDEAEVQMKIARVIAACDTEQLRVIVRKLLVDPNSIESLVAEKYGKNDSLAVWAVELIANDSELEKAVYRANSTLAKCRALSRISDEEIVARIAKTPKIDAIVRYVAIGRLGPQHVELLEILARDSNPTVAAGAIKALTTTDSEKAQTIAAEREKRLQEKKAQRERFLRDRDELDRKEAEREYEKDKAQFLKELVPQYANIDILKDIRNCRGWGKLKRQGKYVGEHKLSFVGRISSTETHWIADDEFDMLIDVYGDSYSVHAKIRRIGDLAIGDRIRVSGSFCFGSDSCVTLQYANVQKIR